MGAIEAAISKQKPSPKVEYLRAFAHQLACEEAIVFSDGHGLPIDEPIELTPAVRRAMAITCTVALNSDVDVSYDDVRKTLGAPEDSSATKR